MFSCPKKRRRHLPATGPGLPTARLVLLRLRSRRGVLGKERLQAPLLGPSRRQTLAGSSHPFGLVCLGGMGGPR